MIRFRASWQDAALLRALATGAQARAVLRALKKAGRDGQRSLNAAANRRVRERKRLKVSRINKAFRLLPAQGNTIGSLRWTVRVGGAPIRVIDYASPRQIRRGVSVGINKDKGKSLIKSAFVATMRSGHRGVFLRTGKARLPIKELYTSRITDVFKDTGATEAVLGRGREAFNTTFRRVLPLELSNKLKR